MLVLVGPCGVLSYGERSWGVGTTQLDELTLAAEGPVWDKYGTSPIGVLDGVELPVPVPRSEFSPIAE